LQAQRIVSTLLETYPEIRDDLAPQLQSKPDATEEQKRSQAQRLVSTPYPKIHDDLAPREKRIEPQEERQPAIEPNLIAQVRNKTTRGLTVKLLILLSLQSLIFAYFYGQLKTEIQMISQQV
jgi:hypothetical protein